MRCDLHVHTRFSGKCTVPVARRFCEESYTAPREAYDRLKAAGMDLVTVTDHDSIDAAAELCQFPDFFPSEEVTIHLPSGNEAHAAVYNLTEEQHLHTQRLRDDLPRLLAYWNEQQLLFGINHAFSALTGRRDPSDFDWFEVHFPIWETRNGAILESANGLAAELAARFGKAVTGGSDSHTVKTLAHTYTEVPGARSVTEFLEGLRRGQGQVAGVSGGYRRVTNDVMGVALGFVRDHAWGFLLTPFLLGIPVATFVHWLKEQRFVAFGRLRVASSTNAEELEDALLELTR